MQIASLHTPLNKTSRKVESAYLLTNTQQKRWQAFLSGSNNFSGYQGWPLNLVLSAGTDGTHCAWLLNLCTSWLTRFTPHKRISLVHTPHFWQVLGLLCTCHTYNQTMNRQSYKLWVYFWKEWGLGHAFRDKTTHTIAWICWLSSPSNFQSLPHHIGNTNHRCKKGVSGGHLWK